MTKDRPQRSGRVLVTGADGFIGQGLIRALIDAGYAVRAATRGPATLPPGVESAVIGDLRRPINLAEALHGADAVIHAAGIGHATSGIPDETYRAVNAGATQALAKAAGQAGVRRFLLLSSVRAQSGPSADEPLTESMPPKPTDAYGRSKLEAEQLVAASGVPFVIFRPVLVHGPGMRFNMAALMNLALSRWPLPLGAFHARRSIVARGHLADAVLLALENRAMEGGTFLVADPEPLSVKEMIAAIRAARQRRPGVFPLPQGLVAMAGRWMGREDAIERLRKPLVADPSRLMAAGWRPRLPAFEALTETARSYV